MMDLDHFKAVNDNFGHAVGDQVLQHFSALVREQLRKIDCAGRIGGEEFAVLLAGADEMSARVFAERLRAKVETTPLQLAQHSVPVTVSIGIAVLTAMDESADETLIRADQALYRAKRGGRNRVEYAALPFSANPADVAFSHFDLARFS